MCQLKKDNKLHINFHNPNSNEDTITFLTKIIATTILEKYLEEVSKKFRNSHLLFDENMLS